MTDSKTRYAALLGVTEPWGVERVEMKREAGEVHVTLALPKHTRRVCPECLAAAPIHDHQERGWRHLDTCQFRTFVHARVPWLDCPSHGIKQIRVPWAEPGSRFTALFEALAIDGLKPSSLSAVAKQMRLTWDEPDGIMARAVARGLARRPPETLRYVGVDETSFQKRHECVTVLSNLEGSKVLYVGNERKRESLDGFWTGLRPEQRHQIEAVAMDMSDLHDPAVAERHFRPWYRWARRGHLEPMKHVALMLKRHWDNIKPFFQHRITNAGAESVNGKIQTVKRRARGFRNRERFRNAIFFHCGGLELYPVAVHAGS